MDSFLKRLRSQAGRLRAGFQPRHRAPDELLGELLQDVQFHQIFDDGMQFVDMIPLKRLNRILKLYKSQRHLPNFDLRKFVDEHFKLPDARAEYVANPDHTIEQHINELWKHLSREEYNSVGSLIGLPHPYIVCGGRFTALYYWDSYFIMLGLAAAGKWDVVEGMVKNFAFLLRMYGHIPNGNRTYYIGRSQPPFFALMVRLLAGHKGKQVLVQYLPYLLIEHHFWIKGSSKLRETRPATGRAVRMPDDEVLNRYYDNKSTPRPEGYREDVHTVLSAQQRLSTRTHLDLRAAAESGWDFSARWCKEPMQLYTVHTTDIVPVDLNCLLLILEQTIADAHRTMLNPIATKRYQQLAARRKAAINKYFWDEKTSYYYDFDLASGERKPLPTIAAVFTLFAGVADDEQADKVADFIKKEFLKPGGLLCTTVETGQQWDWPNGWAPIQWVAIRGLRQYGHDNLADDIKRRWLKTCEDGYQRTHKLVEKYNVVDPDKSAGGGEYSLQDGFGWTNGVIQALLHESEIDWAK